MKALNVLSKLFEVRDQVHFLHLNTQFNAEHMALDIFYKGWLELVDTFVETYQGKYGRIEGLIRIEFVTGIWVKEYLVQVMVFLNDDITAVVNPELDSDLDNIIADMKQLVNQTMFRLTLK